MKLYDTPSTEYAFGYHEAPRSGNGINGHGEKTKRRASHVFHNATGEKLAWRALDDFFSYINDWEVVRYILANTWQLRRQDGPVAREREPVEDTAAAAAAIKDKALELGAGLVGVTLVTEDALFEGHEAPHPNAICIGLPMNREEMTHVPHKRAAIEVMRAYHEVSRIALELAEHIRDLGWPAKAYGNPNSTEILHIPLAIRAGLGRSGGRMDRYIEIDPKRFRGFSGSLLLDGNGQAQGMNTTGLARRKPLTVPTETLRRVVDNLTEHGEVRRGFLGITTSPVRLPDTVESQDVGLLILSVQPGSPAAAAALFLGDVILGIEGEITESPIAILTALTEERIGQQVAMRILRAGEEKTVSVLLGKRK